MKVKYLIDISPTISVVIPTLNRCHTLQRAIGSILKQTSPAKEIIVVDNGSTDGTFDMVRSNFPMVTYATEVKSGVSAARNKGILIANSQWISFLDSDDAWLPTKLEKQIKACDKNNKMRLIHTDEIWFRKGKRVNQMKKHRKRGGNIFEYCLLLCCISPSSVLMRKDLVEDIGLFDEDLPACEDYDMWLRVTSKEPILYLEEALTIKYGGHEDQLSSQFWGMDRFRVYSIEKILCNKLLTSSQEVAARKVMIGKINILIQGGIKRGNMEIVDIYSKKLDDWANEDSKINSRIPHPLSW
jgi:glycosyltransferase involved in cell wall biosynthesis